MPSQRYGSTGGSTRYGGGGSSRYGDAPSSSKKKRDWRDDLLDAFSGPASLGLKHTPWAWSRGLGSGIAALGTSPLQALLFPKSAPGQLWGTVRGSVEGPYAFGKMMRPVERGGGGMDLGDASLMFLSSMKDDYKDRYGPDWKDHARDNSLFNLFDALSVVGAGARVATMGAAAGRLGAAGERATMRNLWKESSRPGVLTTGEEPRIVKYQPLREDGSPLGQELVSTQEWSRSPLRRGTQAMADVLAERFPNTPMFGARARATRQKGGTFRRVMERTFGSITGEEALSALGEDGRSRLFWETQLGIDRHEDIHMRDGMLTRLRNALDEEWDATPEEANPEFQTVLADAKKLGFGKRVLLSRLDDAIDFDPTKGRMRRRYEAAGDAMRQTTALAERTIADSEGFSALKTDLKRISDRIDGLEPQSEEWLKAVTERTKKRQELAQKSGDLEQMFRNRRSLVRDWLDTRGTNEFSEAWHKVLTEAWGKERADHAIATANKMANTMRPDSPESFWADKIGAPSREGAAMFRARVGEDALFQFGESGTGLLDSGFYSNTQKAVVDGMPEQMPKEEFLTWLEENVPKEELYNSGLDMYLQALEPGTVVTKQDFLHVLSSRLNAYNLKQIVRINDLEQVGRTGLETRFDVGENGQYISRGKDVHKAMEPGGQDAYKPHPGEYYEVQFELPGPGVDEAYRGKGVGHWNRENVVVHFRFHIFEEDGIKKLLIEEIQSDWANEFRVAEQARKKRADMSPAEQEEFTQLREDLDSAVAERDKLQTRQREINAQMDRDDLPQDDMFELNNEYYKNADKLDSIVEDIRQSNSILEQYDYGGDLSYVPPSPLGIGTGAKSSYVNSPIRWIGRFAVENDVQQVILVARETQLVRNAKAIDPREWYGGLRDAGAEAVTKHVRENMPDKTSYKGYENDLPRRMRQEWGVKGEAVDDAYEGFYRHPADPNAGGDAAGRMPGTVFEVNDLFRENALKPQALYQRTPDWDALPKGAVELFEGGKSRIHIFEGGDVSTWIHELGHVALGDLPADDLRIVEGHFGGGKAYTEWTQMQHEDFARGFEQYVREGVAPTPQMRPIFAKLSAWIREVWERERRINQDIPAEVSDVFSRLFKTTDEPDVFIPHRAAAPDLAGGRTSRAVPRADRVIGDRTFSRIPIFKKNTLGLLRGGLLNDDPRLALEHANRVVALARANQLREVVVDLAEPLLPNDMPDFKTQYVVKKAGRGVDKPTFDALESAEDPGEIRNTVKKYIDDHITDDRELYEAWKGESQLYVVDKKVVDMLFKQVTGKIPGAATKPVSNTAKVVDATLDSFRALLLYANPGFYITNIIGNSGMLMLKDPAALRYLPWSINEAMKSAVRPEAADPLWQRVSVEMGRGPTSGSFSLGSVRDVLSGQPGEQGNLAGRSAEWWSHGLGEWGRRSGRVIDDSFRVSAWRQSAAKMGYRTDKQVQDLLDHESITHPFRGKIGDLETKAQRDLAKIRDEAEQLMLDFDSMSPWERQYLQRGIFLYPFMKASLKYPVMFAGERPITSGALFGLSGAGEKFAERPDVLGPRADLPEWLQGYARGPFGYFNVGSFSPFNMPVGMLQSIMALRGGTAEPGVQKPWDYSNPVWQMALDVLRQQNEYGRESQVEDILRSEMPLPAYIRQAVMRIPPSDRWQERDFWHTLLRSLRAAPVKINEGE